MLRRWVERTAPAGVGTAGHGTPFQAGPAGRRSRVLLALGLAGPGIRGRPGLLDRQPGDRTAELRHAERERSAGLVCDVRGVEALLPVAVGRARLDRSGAVSE